MNNALLLLIPFLPAVSAYVMAVAMNGWTFLPTGGPRVEAATAERKARKAYARGDVETGHKWATRYHEITATLED